MWKKRDKRIGKRKYPIIMAHRIYFTCQTCHKWGWATFERTICKDCEKGKQIEQLPGDQWLEFTGYVARSRSEEMFFLDLIDRSRPLHYSKESRHFVWSLGSNKDGSWRVYFQGMIERHWPSYDSAKIAVEDERRQIANDIKMRLYHHWPEQCPVCSLPLTIMPAFEGYEDFQYKCCPECGRLWTHWIGEDEVVETAEGAQ